VARASPLACTVGPASAFAVNAALMASQWKHRVGTLSLHPNINAEHEAGQAAITVFEVFGMTEWESNPVNLLWWRMVYH